jgi:hypothetical protein
MRTFRQYLEIKEPLAQELRGWMKKGALAFDNIFQDKYRIAFPYDPDPSVAGLKKIRADLIDKGYEVDLEKGKATKTVETKKGPKKQSMKLGKAIGQALGPDVLKTWDKSGGREELSRVEKEAGKTKYSVIVSRHPIDVARMSDHEGISSCHSQSGSYFNCAVGEAKGFGPIAYLVKDEYLKKVKDLQADEIFADPERDVKGIKPKSRLRLRRFVDRTDKDYELAVPEDRVYGMTPKGFKKAVRSWAVEVQKKEIEEKGGRPRMNDFIRTGGSYTDSTASDLFNAMFGDILDRGDVAGSDDDDDEQDMFAQYEEEAEEINRAYNTFRNAVWADYSIEGDEAPFVLYSGGASVSIPKDEFIKDLPPHRIKKRDAQGKLVWEKGRYFMSDLEEAISDAITSHPYHFYHEEVEINYEGTNVEVVFRIDDPDADGHPDSYRDFLQNLDHEWDNDYDDLEFIIKKTFIEEGFIDKTHPEKMADKLHSEEIKLRNFTWTWDEDDYSLEILSTKTFLGSLKGIDHPEIEKMGWSRRLYSYHIKGGENFVRALLHKIEDYIERVIKTSASQMFLPGMSKLKPTPSFHDIWKHLDGPQMRFSKDEDQNVYLEIEFTLDMRHGEEEVEAARKYLKHLDNMWPQMAREAVKIFDYSVKMAYETEAKRMAQQAAALKSLEGRPIQGKIGEPRPV